MNTKETIATFALVGALILGFVWVGAYFEAKAFNRITGSDVTTWEACWVKLRVDRPYGESER